MSKFILSYLLANDPAPFGNTLGIIENPHFKLGKKK